MILTINEPHMFGIGAGWTFLLSFVESIRILFSLRHFLDHV